MKVFYPVKENVDVKEIKEALKPFGGRCAKIVEGQLEYQIKEEKESEAHACLKEKGYID
ncbi:hypothetical protein RCG24_05940 [Neobacillus sp. OS1-32]|uniref:Uncharacterized protein n=1 Tax=Neobacillus paridis TaxID=2803862 RepID=A0ABS1TP36_9BACI|nr:MULTISPECIES: hypothetical protein [Neobacillus]MBL4953076.1 hypothetical protein [Neobacillus paridis]WML31410.1 hypothetical protein RCG24_05940 [Neobacillus sp. OS1-32]